MLGRRWLLWAYNGLKLWSIFSRCTKLHCWSAWSVNVDGSDSPIARQEVVVSNTHIGYKASNNASRTTMPRVPNYRVWFTDMAASSPMSSSRYHIHSRRYFIGTRLEDLIRRTAGLPRWRRHIGLSRQCWCFAHDAIGRHYSISMDAMPFTPTLRRWDRFLIMTEGILLSH